MITTNLMVTVHQVTHFQHSLFEQLSRIVFTHIRWFSSGDFIC